LEKGRFKLTRAERIAKSQEYQRIFKQGKRLRFPEFTLIVALNDLAISRVGISVGKKFGKAVKRNRAKRLCRELFRLNKHNLPKGVDVIFLPNKLILHSNWQKLQNRMEEVGRLIEKFFKFNKKAA